ncbi:hypothetical protein H4S07_002795 [Coemansia furcata]|uniref:Uncharacterized protein n=1 Tax=Coemansia furcata TaxID=417177 RepID=A0ACC1LJ39_9FUNG|nr:hypothetical protein H4S07_002795 [Coemansia furcata]
MRGQLKSAFKSVMGNPTLAMINMAGGVPHPSTFPIMQLRATIKSPSSSSAPSNRESTLELEKSCRSKSAESLDELLQYGDGCGIDSYCAFLRRYTQRVHCPRYADWGVIASCGNTDAIGKAVSLFCEPGDSILVDRWTFPGALSSLASAKVQPIPVPMDSEGMIPEALDNICHMWSGSAPPRAIYLVPTGQNPTGTTMSLARRKAIYTVAQKHNLAIIEDDPYYFLQLPSVSSSSHLHREVELSDQGQDLIPSLLSLDTDGRVIRLDSFSKILAPNLRCGWITAPTYILDKIQILNESTILQPSGLSQGLISKLLNDTWGFDGWEAHLRELRALYTLRRNLFIQAVDRHLAGLVEYTVPTAGMFLWMKINLGNAAADPTAMSRLLGNMKKCGVMMAPDMPFSSSGPSATMESATGGMPERYLRAAFALVDIDMFELGLKRLAQAIASVSDAHSATTCSPATSLDAVRSDITHLDVNSQ